MNYKEVRQIFFGCGFQHRLLVEVEGKTKKDKKPVATREVNIQKVFKCIKKHKNITKGNLLKTAGVSVHVLNSSLRILVDRCEINEKVIGKSGSYNIKSYSKAKNEK